MADPEEIIVGNVRRLSGVPAGKGPNDAHVLAAIQGFAKDFDYWYIRVMRGAVSQYRTIIIKRINPFIRPIQYEGLDCAKVAERIVEDYNNRNFVTAGGWALEQLALSVNPDFQKSAARGIDLQRHDPTSSEYHLYVLKSGLVTRNSDIVNALKKHSKDAEKLLRQSGSRHRVTLNYAIVAGKTTSTFEDGVRRPSSSEFWSEVMKLAEIQAVDLALAIAAEAGRIVRSDATQYVVSLRTLVAAYIAQPGDPTLVDWDFIKRRNFQDKKTWAAEDKSRHDSALRKLEEATGAPPPVNVVSGDEDAAAEEAIETSDLPDIESRPLTDREKSWTLE